MKNPSEQNAHAVGAWHRGVTLGKLEENNPDKVQNARHKTISNFLKGRPMKNFCRTDKLFREKE